MSLYDEVYHEMHQIKTTENYLARLAGKQKRYLKYVQSLLIIFTLFCLFNYNCKFLIYSALVINLIMASLQLIGPNVIPDSLGAYKLDLLSNEYRKYFNDLKPLFRDMHDSGVDLKRDKRKYCQLNKRFDYLEGDIKEVLSKRINNQNPLWTECENDAITEIKTIFK